MPKITKNRIIFDQDDWLFGLHQQFGVADKQQSFTDGLADSSSFDPFRKWGYASVGYDPVDVTNVSEVDGFAKNGVMEDNMNAYFIAGTKIHQIHTTSSTITNTGGDYPHTIAGTAAEAEDIVKYTISGTEYIFYSYNDTTDGNIGRLEVGTPTFVDSYWQGTLSAAPMDKYVGHPMIVGDDDLLYIGNGNSLNAIDSSGVTAVIDALVIPAGFEIISFAKIQPRTLVIFASKTPNSGGLYKGECKAYFWDYISEDPYDVQDIYGNLMGEAFEFRGSIGCFTQGATIDRGAVMRGNTLFLYNGDVFKEIASTSANLPIRGGVEVIGRAIYANMGGDLYSFGNPMQGINAGLHKIAEGDGSTSGMLRTFFGFKQLISSGTGTSGGLELLDIGKYSTGSFSTVFATPDFGSEFQGRIKNVRVEFTSSATGGREFKLELVNRDGISLGIALTGLIEIGSSETILKRDSDTSGNPFKMFDSIQGIGTWGTGDGNTDAPSIKRIIIDYEPTNIK